MRKVLMTIGIVSLLPIAAIAGGSHSGGQHGHTDNSDDHREADASGHTSVVGSPAEESAASRTVQVELLDTMRFAFDVPLELKRGEVVRFKVTNRGQIRHEFSIGSEVEQDSHRAMMRSMPNMVHEDPNAVTVEPGETRELIWRFEGKDPVVFACNIPGHAEAGMVVTAMLKP